MAVFLASQPVLADDEKANIDASIAAANLREMHQLAEMGDANWQIELAGKYASGNGVSQDFSEAAKWYQLAANQNRDDAQLKLALMYLSGQGVPQDNKMAAALFRASAEQGNPDAQYNLGVMLTKEVEGGGDQEAVKWLSKAADQRHSEAQVALDVLSRKVIEQGQVKPQENLNASSAKAANEDIKKTESVSGTSDLLDIFLFSLLVAIGLGLAILCLLFLSGYYRYRKLSIFTKQAKVVLNDFQREIPEALTSALKRAKVGMALRAVVVIFCAAISANGLWLAAIILILILFANIERLFSKCKLALRFIDSVRSQDGLFCVNTILTSNGIASTGRGLLGKLEGLSQSKKEKEKKAEAYEDAVALLTGVLACLESIGEIQVFDLGDANYFCKSGYIDVFCDEVIASAGFKAEESGVKQLKKLVKVVQEKTGMEKEHAYNLVTNYFTRGKVYVKSGRFEFYTEDRLDSIVLCDCCGQVVNGGGDLSSQLDVFCSEACERIYQKVSSENFEPGEKFASASRLINYGVDGIITSATATQYAENQKVFAIGGQGHGFAAEKANTYIDQLQGKTASVVGDDNAKSGPDRLVDGQMLQAKYCKTAANSIGQAFDGNDQFRYFDDSGNPMPIEVPKDQYQAAVKVMARHIQLGHVPGVSDSNEANKLVAEGNITYDQAKNIAKFGTVEGMLFDTREGVVSVGKGASISFLLNYSQSYWRTKDTTQALQVAVVSATKAFTKQVTTMVLVQQLHRTELVQSFVKSISVPQSLTPGLARGLNVSQSQVKNALGGMIIANAVVISLSASRDMFHVINNQMSGRHFVKNTLVTTAGVVGGSTGAIAGKIIGGALGGTIGGPPGAFLGAAVVGHLATLGAKSILDEYIEDDRVATARLVKYQIKFLADQYLMTPEETQVVVETALDDAMLITPNQSATVLINANILPYVIHLVRNRPPVRLNEFQLAGQRLVSA